MSNVPSLEVSKWNHGSPTGGIAFTAKHETDILISCEDMIKCIAEQADSRTLAGLLDELIEAYSSANGIFSVGYAVADLGQQARDFIKILHECIEDSEK